METAYLYLALSGALTILLWTPYVLVRMFQLGFFGVLYGYSEGFPVREKTQPDWAVRAKRAHLNMVETLPAFVAVVLAAGMTLEPASDAASSVALWAQLFFYSRIAHAIVYTLAVPYLRTPVYLLSWLAVLAIAWQAVMTI